MPNWHRAELYKALERSYNLISDCNPAIEVFERHSDIDCEQITLTTDTPRGDALSLHESK